MYRHMYYLIIYMLYIFNTNGTFSYLGYLISRFSCIKVYSFTMMKFVENKCLP